LTKIVFFFSRRFCLLEMTRSFFSWPSSKLVGQQACAVDDGQHVDLILFYAVDDPVGTSGTLCCEFRENDIFF
jgi:hypothetical protein